MPMTFRKDYSIIGETFNNASRAISTAADIWQRERNIAEAAYNADRDIYATAWESEANTLGTNLASSLAYDSYENISQDTYDQFFNADYLVSTYGGTKEHAERFIRENGGDARTRLMSGVARLRNSQMQYQTVTKAQSKGILMSTEIGSQQGNGLDGANDWARFTEEFGKYYTANGIASADTFHKASLDNFPNQLSYMENLISSKAKAYGEARISETGATRQGYLDDIGKYIDSIGSSIDLSDPTNKLAFDELKASMLASAEKQWDIFEQDEIRNSADRTGNVLSELISRRATTGSITADDVVEILAKNNIDLSNRFDRTNSQAILQEWGISENMDTNRKVMLAMSRASYSALTDEDFVTTTVRGNYGTYDISRAPSEDTPLFLDEVIAEYNATREQADFSYTISTYPNAERLAKEAGIETEEEWGAFLAQYSKWEEGITRSSTGSTFREVGGEYVPVDLSPDEANLYAAYLDPTVDLRSLQTYAYNQNIRGTVSSEFANWLFSQSREDLSTPELNDAMGLIKSFIGTMGDDSARESTEYFLTKTPEGRATVSETIRNSGGANRQALEELANSTYSTLSSEELSKDVGKAMHDLMKNIGAVDSTFGLDINFSNNTASTVNAGILNGTYDMFLDSSAIADMKRDLRQSYLGDENLSTNELKDLAAQRLYGRDFSELSQSEKNIASLNLASAVTDVSRYAAVESIVGSDDIFEIYVDGVGSAVMDSDGYVYIPTNQRGNMLISYLGKNSMFYNDIVTGRGQRAPISISGREIIEYSVTSEEFYSRHKGPNLWMKAKENIVLSKGEREKKEILENTKKLLSTNSNTNSLSTEDIPSRYSSETGRRVNTARGIY